MKTILLITAITPTANAIPFVITPLRRSPWRRRTLLSSLVATAALLLLLSAASTFAGSATWNLNPTSGDWDTATNWTPATIPNGPADTATFDVSNITVIYLAYDIDQQVNGIVFNPGASGFTISTGF